MNSAAEVEREPGRRFQVEVRHLLGLVLLAGLAFAWLARQDRLAKTRAAEFDALAQALSRRTPTRRIALPGAAVLVPTIWLVPGDDPRRDEPAIDGTWQATSAELGGAKLPKGATDGIKLTLRRGQYEVMAESLDRGTVTYDASAKPKAMEIRGTDGPNKGRTIPAIYELTGDKLTICYDLSGMARPAEFKSRPKTRLFLVTYERRKP